MAITSFQSESVYYKTSSSNHAGQLNVTYIPHQCDLEHFCLDNAFESGGEAYLYYFALWASDHTSFGLKHQYHYIDDESREVDNFIIDNVRTDADTDNAVTRAGNGGYILDLANTQKYNQLYFGGVTQDATSIMAYLNEKYGQHLYYFVTRTYNIASRPNTLYPELWNLQPGAVQSMEISADFTDPLACLNGYVPSPPAGLPAYVENTGIEIGYPQDLDGDYDDFVAFMLFGEPINPKQVNFDVYINGTKDPVIAVRWSGEGDQSFQTTSPIVWCYPTSMGMDEPLITVDGITVPNDSQWYVAKHAYTWGGAYDGQYLSECNSITSGLSDFEKVVKYGLDGIPNSLHLYIRANQQVNDDNEAVMTWGNLYDVFIPREVNSLSDIIVNTVGGSSNDPRFSDTLTVHLGAAPDETEDDSDDYPDGTDAGGDPGGVYPPGGGGVPDFTGYEPAGFPGEGVLTTTYSMIASVLENLGSKLWTQSYFDVLKIQSNPIENIVSCKWFPFSITGASAPIVIGDVDMQVNGSKISSIYSFTVGSYTYSPDNSFLYCSPYTTIKLHLPFCGIIQLDASEIYKRKLTIKYAVDLITGDCIAMIYLDGSESNPGVPYLTVSGSCGVDIPLTATTRAQTEMKAASATMSAVVGASAHLMGGDAIGAAASASSLANVAGMDYTSQRSTSHSPACMSKMSRAVFIEIIHPAYDPDMYNKNGYKSRHGYPCHKYKTLSSFSGFVKCDMRTKLDFAATGEENKMIEDLLTEGVYV